ncbi:Peptide methionine sulfoxide reductase MsrA [bacterium HR40]|nr:Peptide methionine sulfoxide reductase MsrA [bacterium HR40]
MSLWSRKSLALPQPEEALPGRDAYAFPLATAHRVSGRSLVPPFPAGFEQVLFGMGCFWGAERRFWQQPGVWVTAVGYSGGYTPYPTYAEVCTGRTGHAEVVLVVFDPQAIPFARLLEVFFTGHDPTQGMRQGNDIGTQYRSAIFTTTVAQAELAERARRIYGEALARHGFGPITTQIAPAGPFWYAEADHQQYLARDPQGYCGLGGTGVAFPAGWAADTPETERSAPSP